MIISFFGYGCIWINMFYQDFCTFLQCYRTISIQVTDFFYPVRTHRFNQSGRSRRSHPEEEGHVMTKGNSGRTTPAVAASEKRKSLKLVSKERGEKGTEEKCRQKCRLDKKERFLINFLLNICQLKTFSHHFLPLGLSLGVSTLCSVSVSSPQLLWSGRPQDPCPVVEQ